MLQIYLFSISSEADFCNLEMRLQIFFNTHNKQLIQVILHNYVLVELK